MDVTAEREAMEKFHVQARLMGGHSIVTANKNPVAFSDFLTFQALTGDVNRYGYSCSVMAGAPTIPFLRSLPDLNEGLISMEGCLSGTLGYLLTGL